MLDFNKTDLEILKTKRSDRFFYYINELVSINYNSDDVNDIRLTDKLAEKWHTSPITAEKFVKLHLNKVNYVNKDDAMSIHTFVKTKGEYKPILSFHNEEECGKDIPTLKMLIERFKNWLKK
jgi:hypothetical protein